MEIVNRGIELEIALNLIAEVSYAPHSREQCVIEFYGIPGVGKSTLLRKIREISTSYRVSIIHVDFNGIQYRRLSFDEFRIILGQALFDQLDLDLLARTQIQSDLSSCIDAESVDRERKLLTLYDHLLAVIIQSSPLNRYLFVLDSLDKLAEDALAWLEEQMLEPLVKSQNVHFIGIIVASRSRAEWTSIQLRTATETHEIQPLSEDETVLQVEQTLGRSLGKQIYQSTNGLPLSNNYAVRRIKELEESGFKLAEDNFGAYEARLVRDLVATVLEKEVMIAPPSLVEIFRVASVASFVDLDLLHELLKLYFPERPRENRMLFLLQASMTDPKLNLAKWETGKNGVVIDPVIRKTLALDLRLNRTAVYEHTCKAVIETMQKRIEKDYHANEAILEILYQESNILSLPHNLHPDLTKQLQERLQGFLSLYCRGRQGLYQAVQLKQILVLFVELRLRLGDHLERLEQTIEDFIESETREQERISQKLSLGISRLQGSESTDEYLISLSAPEAANGISEKMSPPRQIRESVIEILSQAVETSTMINVGTALLHNYVPSNLRRQLFDTELPIAIVTDDNSLPWEFMFDGTKFLCREKDVARVSSGLQDLIQSSKVKRRLNRILLIANPTDDESMREAEKEVTEIASLSQKAGFIPDVWYRDASIFKFSLALSQENYGIIHFAGHAEFIEIAEEKSGLVLSDGIFPISSISANLKGSPFVFLNACYSGKSDRVEFRSWRWGVQSLGIASAFVNSGATGCIGSLWQISNNSASRFATSFYKAVFDGATVSNALRKARLSFAQEDPAWAAYIMYSDPLYRLVNSDFTH